jgi:very-short-patch-repair endonuclease
VRGVLSGKIMRAQSRAIARYLRRNSTWAEKELWRQLRNRKQIGAKFRRQYAMGCYVLDFYCTEKKLCIELDGGQHDFPGQRRHDEVRDAFLVGAGIRTLRFWNSQVGQNLTGVLWRIRKELGEEEFPSPWPSPPRGEGTDCGEERYFLFRAKESRAMNASSPLRGED